MRTVIAPKGLCIGRGSCWRSVDECAVVVWEDRRSFRDILQLHTPYADLGLRLMRRIT